MVRGAVFISATREVILVVLAIVVKLHAAAGDKVEERFAVQPANSSLVSYAGWASIADDGSEEHVLIWTQSEVWHSLHMFVYSFSELNSPVF